MSNNRPRFGVRAIVSLAGALSLAISFVAGADTVPDIGGLSMRGAVGAETPNDPAREARIAELTAERDERTARALARVREKNARYSASRDRAERMQLAEEIRDEKRELERRNMRIGLEIATLRGRHDRAALFADALEGVTR